MARSVPDRPAGKSLTRVERGLGGRFPRPRQSKKDQILALFDSGIADIEELAQMSGSKPSYVASVLQKSGHLHGYFDLYTRSSEAMNVYSQFFRGQLGFRDLPTARRSVEIIDQFYRQFEHDRDRAGQHHALSMALTMFDRARWCGKSQEGEVFRQWLIARLYESVPTAKTDS